ncbi:MAG TPA: circadian clock KaiB family protein [Roseiflexaceae bacterium]|nr:circadian clock KaiB family protein [Roseiflexaceae bacterium]HMP41030.1 circadian clock KaiB family protein [Roseiflexaceae bacterium]
MNQEQESETPSEKVAAFERAVQQHAIQSYHLRLYIAGASQLSTRAITTLTAICEKYLHGRYRLEVVDVYQNPEQAHADNVIATPTLVMLEPLPQQVFVGDVAHSRRLAAILGIPLPE